MKAKVAGFLVASLAVFGVASTAVNTPHNDEQPNVVESKNTESEIETKEQKPEEKKKTYKVINVVDGDTIDVDMDGKTQRIRLIGVNTPETVHPEKTVEYFGKEASEYTKKNLTGKTVEIETDDSQDKYDKYGRMLAYVIVDGKNFNKSLIEDGYAYEYTYNVPYKYQSEFKNAQKNAEKNNKGLWAPKEEKKTEEKKTETKKTETKKQNTTQKKTNTTQKKTNTTTKKTNNTKKTTNNTQKKSTNTSTNNKSNCKIKGNINSKGEKIYHVPGGAYYNKTGVNQSKGERWFCSEAEAQRAGWRRSKR